MLKILKSINVCLVNPRDWRAWWAAVYGVYCDLAIAAAAVLNVYFAIRKSRRHRHSLFSIICSLPRVWVLE